MSDEKLRHIKAMLYAIREQPAGESVMRYSRERGSNACGFKTHDLHQLADYIERVEGEHACDMDRLQKAIQMHVVTRSVLKEDEALKLLVAEAVAEDRERVANEIVRIFRTYDAETARMYIQQFIEVRRGE